MECAYNKQSQKAVEECDLREPKMNSSLDEEERCSIGDRKMQGEDKEDAAAAATSGCMLRSLM